LFNCCVTFDIRGREFRVPWCGLRGYEAALILQTNGYKNVKLMEGGVMAWPWEREK
jgi:hypothetical protein